VTRAPTERTAAPWRNRIVGTGEEAPDRLLANPRNWRLHPSSQQEALASVLDDVGWVGQVLVNRRTGMLVDGHLRVELAQRRRRADRAVGSGRQAGRADGHGRVLALRHRPGIRPRAGGAARRVASRLLGECPMRSKAAAKDDPPFLR
jgi:hypothetical protein